MIGALVLGALSAVALIGGAGVVLTRNVVYAAIFLLMAMMAVAGVFILLLAEFLALVQVLVYGGAITIVVLFALWLTRAPEQAHVEDNPQRFLAAIASFALFVVFVAAAVVTPWPAVESPVDPLGGFTGLSTTLFSDFLVAFEVASLVLLVALIGAVILTKGGRERA